MQASTLRRALCGAVLLAGLMQQAGATIVTVTGDTTGGPTWTRIDEDPGNWPYAATYPGTTYRAFAIDILAPGEVYNFASTCAFDCSMYIYAGTFDPARPKQNFFFGNGNAGSWATAAFGGPLDAGRYTLVVSGEDATWSGFFSTTISGDSEFQVTALNPVPEPSTWLMFGAGLAGLGVAARRRTAQATTAN